MPGPKGGGALVGIDSVRKRITKGMEMSLKLKVLGLSLIATVALSAVAVMNASANGEGHLVTTGATGATVEGHVSTPPAAHNLHFRMHGFNGEIGCHKQTHVATIAGETAESLTVTPTYSECGTTPNTDVTVTVNGCTYTFTVAKGSIDATEQTAHLFCPAGKAIEVHHPNCTVTIHPQTTTTGLTYTQKTNAATLKHEITMDVNVEFNITRHGACQLFGTNGKGTLVGSVTVTAKKAGAQVHLTRT